MLFRYVYSADSDPDLTDSDVRHLVQVSQRNNALYGITGVLIWTGSSFVQVLEGTRSAVKNTLVRIGADPRHLGIHEISSQWVERRIFPAWSMQGVFDLRGVSAELLVESLSDGADEAPELVLNLARTEGADGYLSGSMIS
ncbi:MAG: BLUF domain-containing protein [Alphaproteobacteria bacterium]|nr:BLUF domain-containing protein [Alphaproteobacteria bacterium]